MRGRLISLSGDIDEQKVRGAKALALLRGRTYATPQEIFDLAPEVLRHRLILTYDALARDISIEHVLHRVLSTVPTMWVSPKPNDSVWRG